jgi:hypothetical protein
VAHHGCPVTTPCCLRGSHRQHRYTQTHPKHGAAKRFLRGRARTCLRDKPPPSTHTHKDLSSHVFMCNTLPPPPWDSEQPPKLCGGVGWRTCFCCCVPHQDESPTRGPATSIWGIRPARTLQAQTDVVQSRSPRSVSASYTACWLVLPPRSRRNGCSETVLCC